MYWLNQHITFYNEFNIQFKITDTDTNVSIIITDITITYNSLGN